MALPWSASLLKQYGKYGIGGGTIAAEQYSTKTGEPVPRHWISRNIDKIHKEFPTLDYLILEGGTNDADLIGLESPLFGSYDPEDFSGSYDDTTFTGALEMLFYKAINYYPKSKIGFIVAHKMGTAKESRIRRRTYFDRAV